MIQQTTLNGHTFYYLNGHGCWVAWMDNELIVIPANTDKSIGSMEECHSPDDASYSFLIAAFRLVK